MYAILAGHKGRRRGACVGFNAGYEAEGGDSDCDSSSDGQNCGQAGRVS